MSAKTTNCRECTDTIRIVYNASGSPVAVTDIDGNPSTCPADEDGLHDAM